jgi:hypothetical protein
MGEADDERRTFPIQNIGQREADLSLTPNAAENRTKPEMSSCGIGARRVYGSNATAVGSPTRLAEFVAESKIWTLPSFSRDTPTSALQTGV